uniref:Uncharacterized protein n=1 Tax=Oryza rufipogon TaxID=4529 RepID=A0A0E0P3Q2_ORYRU
MARGDDGERLPVAVGVLPWQQQQQQQPTNFCSGRYWLSTFPFLSEDVYYIILGTFLFPILWVQQKKL